MELNEDESPCLDLKCVELEKKSVEHGFKNPI